MAVTKARLGFTKQVLSNQMTSVLPEFRPEDLARDFDLRSYALDDLKISDYSDTCVQRHTIGVLNLCRHLHYMNLPKSSTWRHAHGACAKLKALDPAEVYADVEEILNPVRLVCNYQLPKRSTWREVISALLALKHVTGHHTTNDEKTEPYPYELAANRHRANADRRGIRLRLAEKYRREATAFEDRWDVVPNAATAAIQLVQTAMDSDTPPDRDALQELILTLPLPPGVITKEEKEKQDRAVMQQEHISQQDWEDEIVPLTQHQEKKQITEAIWQERQICRRCSGSGLSLPTEKCPSCDGVGTVS